MGRGNRGPARPQPAALAVAPAGAALHAVPNPHPPGEPVASFAPKDAREGDSIVPTSENFLGLGGLLALAAGAVAATRARLAALRRRGRAVSGAPVLRRLLRLPAVVRRVEPRALVMHRDRVEDTLQRSLAAHGARRRAVLGHAVKHLE